MRKAIAIIMMTLTFLLAFCTVSGAYDVAGRKDEDTFILLKSLGIMEGDENGDFHPDNPINRAEYTAMILRLLNMEELSKTLGIKHDFKDVPHGHWSENYISLAFEIGLVQGTDDENFGLNYDVRYQDAVKMIVCALGYKTVAERNGGYPSGYIKTATGLGLLKDVKGTDVFTRANAAKLMKNSLTVEIVDYLGNVYKGNDVLSAYHNITAMRGVVTGTPYHLGEKRIPEDSIEISGELYKTVGMNTENFMGAEVQYYLKEDIEGNKTVYHIKETNNEEAVIVSAEDILETTSLQVFTYRDKSGAKEELMIDDRISIYYNGSIVKSMHRSDEILKPTCGEVLLRDRDGDGNYDIAIVKDYSFKVVKAVKDGIIYDKFDENINTNDVEILMVEKSDGNIELDAVESGSVVSAMCSLDGNVIRLFVSKNAITGRIKSVTNYGTEETECIVLSESGEEIALTVSADYRKAQQKGHAETIAFKPEITNCRFLINEFGQICDVEALESDEAVRYGYLIDIAKLKDLSEGVSIRVLTAKNTIEVYTAPQKLSYGRRNGEKYVFSRVDGSELIRSLQENGKLKHSLITYRINAEGVLTELCTEGAAFDNVNFSCDAPKSAYIYKNKVLSQSYYVGNNTIVFSVPENGYDVEMMVSCPADAFFADDKRYECSLYDIKGNIPTVIVVHDNITKRYATTERGYESMINYGSSPVLYINNVIRVLGTDGEVYTALSGYQNGREVTMALSGELFNDEERASKLKAGVAILYDVNAIDRKRALHSGDQEVIIDFEILFDFTKNTEGKALWNNDTIELSNADMFVAWGILERATDTYCSVSFYDEGVAEDVYYTGTINDNTIVLKYDKSKKSFIIKNIAELAEGQNVFMRQSYSKTKELVLY